ncbi:Sec-independent protein translocase subunit TatA [Streptomyces sp. ACA25]|uniref:Sec-independent protein translocase subunit TatA n=1 Tax=Streptomyces sp. ACA25 TaxID=3022596 RepID=UPI002307586B|nr:Sec-independent protein translocase subunit TatA [Streptomyces sp. ACA25]MDB1089011.1 Sec-independent protein translocase subunit TatA [Streptomyces sp. ACA25]
MMGQIGPWQIVIIIAVIVLIFGAKRLPDTARALGKSLRILKSETSALKTDGESRTDTPASEDSEPPAPPKTIRAAPGDVASSRPVEEPKGTTQG